MEEMEEDVSDLFDDHNHNSHAHVVSVFTPAQVCVDSSDSCSDTCESDSSPAAASNGAALLLNSASKFLMNAMTAEDYRTIYWPKLERAIEHLLTQSPMDHISISYEQIYSHVYKCVCQQHSELLYSDLIWKITSHLEHVSSELQASPPESLIENFNVALTQYTAALHCIVPVFIYMNKFYIETKLNRDLRDDLMKLFSEHVAEKHVSTLLHWVALAPALFSRFIPQIDPPALESHLPYYAAQDKKLQMELSQNGFSRGDQSRKRASEES
ncbi:CDK2-associated and cullin domain-containing protein 1 isoform X2 [Myxocyprinus asiaticus]|uniref:CDK2-associated and cullin domain-containing protein 1 isoform X2 n=1 Tax=Myxocyprinus asiaticus TaxID=70543 RepID=UPI0022221561|nr:CDK2-associated and cullin domain-containing protein 1 isoform X2 [Myxocyprinus asiaticus]